jgi:hypothetical protein
LPAGLGDICNYVRVVISTCLKLSAICDIL